MNSYESCKAAAQLASQGKGAGAEDTISLDVHSINELKVVHSTQYTAHSTQYTVHSTQ